MIELKPPYGCVDSYMSGHSPYIFLAGSIEMGTAEKWQDKVTAELKETNAIVFNPRRDEWDSSWEQTKENLQFRQQVEWELRAISSAYIVFFYFDPSTKSPISLLELGLCLGDGTRNVIVCCPPTFYRKGNVDITCERCGIRVYDSFEDAVKALKVLTSEY